MSAEHRPHTQWQWLLGVDEMQLFFFAASFSVEKSIEHSAGTCLGVAATGSCIRVSARDYAMRLDPMASWSDLQGAEPGRVLTGQSVFLSREPCALWE